MREDADEIWLYGFRFLLKKHYIFGGGKLIRWFLLLVLQTLAGLRRRFERNGGFVLVPAPVPEANRGDQALLIAAVEEIQRRSAGTLVLVASSQHPIQTYPKTARVEVRQDPSLYLAKLVRRHGKCLGGFVFCPGPSG